MLFFLTKSTILIQEFGWNLTTFELWAILLFVVNWTFSAENNQAADGKDFPFSKLKMFGVWIHLKPKPAPQGMV